MYIEEQLNACFEEYLKLPLNDSAIDFLIKHQKEEYFFDLLKAALDDALDMIQRIYSKYNESLFKSSSEISTYIRMCKLCNEGFYYYVAISRFFENKNDEVMVNIKKAHSAGFLGDETHKFTLDDFANCFVAPFKGAYNGFWEELCDFVDKMYVDSGSKELCHAVLLFYYSDNSLEIRSAFERVLEINSDCDIAKELLALSYYNDSMWGNSVAYFEQIEVPLTLPISYMYVLMGWCYRKLHEKANEITAFEKSVEVFGENAPSLFDLGYAYYMAKQYNKALECFKKCIDYNIDIKYAVNNYAKTLLAMKRFKDAKQFAKSAPTKLHKDIIKKIEESDGTNKHISADKPIEEPIEIREDNEIRSSIDFGVKKQQFTSEKILEDELVLRIERGLPVFGLNLKLYRRNGVYGRQYILSNGKRLDLLAEDTNGNLYVIELKKDSGYDDAYTQTAEYLNWFDENWKEPVKNIYGIICLNDPSKELLEKVHKDKRMRIFEYQISYTER